LLDLSVEKSVERLLRREGPLKPEQISFLRAQRRPYQCWASEIGAVVLDASSPPEALIELLGRRLLELL
jgi:thymidylate kinase